MLACGRMADEPRAQLNFVSFSQWRAQLCIVFSPGRPLWLQPIIDNPSALLHGEHTRSIVKKTPTARAGGIMMFAVKKLKVNLTRLVRCLRRKECDRTTWLMRDTALW